nr:ACT domain-containing protein ACR9-like [Quercus suber]
MEWQQRFAVLCELELTMQRVKVMTTPDGSVLDLFFITDNMRGFVLGEILHTKKRQDETLEQLHAVLGESCISCELQLAGTEYERPQGISSLSPEVAEELFGYELSDNEICSQALGPDMSKLKKASVTVDNSLSPAHTLLQIHCADHKGLLYDIMRTLKDCNIQIASGRFSPNSMGYHDLDQRNRVHYVLLGYLEMEDHKFFMMSLALKSIGICIFSQVMWQIGNLSSYIANALPLHMLAWAEVGRYSTSESDHEWEVHRFLSDENCRFQLSKMIARNQIVDRRTLMGCLEYRQAQNADAASVISEHYHVECSTKHDPAARVVITLQTLKSIRRRAKAKQALALM